MLKLNKVILKNFRNYINEQVFELNENITILYGDNGNGKSSFFDGIEWCLTGLIGRFSEKKPPKEVIANKNMKLHDECSVEIYFSRYRLKRGFIKNENGFGNIEFALYDKNKKLATGEENVDTELRGIFKEQGIDYRNIKYRVGEKINKAYILSQDQVTDFVTRDTPKERYIALANIMGFERVLKVRRNINNTLKSLKEIREEANEERKKLQNEIDELLKEKKPFDSTKLVNFKETYNLEPTKENLLLKTKELQNRLFTIERDYEDLTKGNYEKLNSIEDINESMEQKTKELNILNTELKDLMIVESKLNDEVQKIISLLERLDNNQKLNNKLLDLNNKLSKLLKELADLEINEKNNTEELKYIINELKKSYRKIEFTKKYNKEYYYAKEILYNFENKLKEFSTVIENSKKELFDVKSKKDALEKQILQIDDDSALKLLLRNIEDIFKYIRNNNINDICPVCSSDLNGLLHNRVSKNLNDLISKVGKEKDTVVRKINERDQYELKESALKNRIQTLEFEINDLISKKNWAEETINFIQNNELYSDYFLKSEENLKEIEEECIDKLDLYNNGLKIWEQIKSIQEELETIEVDKKLLGIDIRGLKEKHTLIKNEVQKIKSKIVDKEKAISIINDDIFKYKQLQNLFQNYFTKYSASTVAELLQTLESNKEKIGILISNLRNILTIIEIQNFNEVIDKKLRNVSSELEIVENKLTKINKNADNLEKLLNKLDNEYGAEASDFLNSEKSSIQMYYKYLNPSPEQFNKLYFDVVNNEDLYIKVLENRDEGIGESSSYCADANMVLSSGQLNVLALSIFIATNESQQDSYFDFIAIDDPIQNMDDVNRYSICDVLSQLSRQLIFSTHDQDFLNLFLKKNEHNLENITLYMLNANENKYVPLTL